ncbi:MAG: CapA family protein [Acidimicrobiia bacterium]
MNVVVPAQVAVVAALVGMSVATPTLTSPIVPEVPESETATLLVTGEMLIHPRVSNKAAQYAAGTGADYDFTPMFQQVEPLIQAADLALCHLEVQLGVPDVPVAGWPRIAAPGEFAESLAQAGFDGCSTASNHANDQGDIGVHSTIDVLDAAGVGHTGTAKTEPVSPGVLYQLDGLTIGHLSYTWAVQAHKRAHPWSISKIDAAVILDEAATLKRMGAEFVAVSLHWGNEFQHRPSRSQRTLADTLTASPNVDLIVGHHAHVLQPVEYVNGKVVLYGLGNFLSNQAPDCCGVESGDGAAVLLRLVKEDGEWMVADLEYVPTWVHRRAGGYLVKPTATWESADQARRALRASLQRSEEALTIAGSSRSGLTVAEGVAWLRRMPGFNPMTSQLDGRRLIL